MDPTQVKVSNKGSRGKKNNGHDTGIYYAKSKSGKEFTQVKIKDTHERL